MKQTKPRFTIGHNGNKSLNVALSVYDLFKKGFILREISRELNLSERHIQRYTRDLKAFGLIKKIGYGVWECTDKTDEEIGQIIKKTPYVTKKGFKYFLNGLSGKSNFKNFLKVTNNYKCLFCNKKDELHIHHLIPLYMNGNNDFNNLISVCKEHHTFIHANGLNDTGKQKIKEFHNLILRNNQKIEENEIRGHGFVFNLKIPKINNWNKRTDFLKKNNIQYKEFNKYQSITFKNHKIWLADKSITIYFKKDKSIFENTAEKSENTAIYEAHNLIKALENLLNTSFEINKKYYLRVSRHHFGRIKDELAKKLNNNKDKLNIKLENGWFIIDNSFQLNEAETQGKEAIEYMNTYQNFIKSLMEAPFTAYDFKAIYDVLTKYTIQMDQHLKVEEETLKTQKKIQELIEEFKNFKMNKQD